MRILRADVARAGLRPLIAVVVLALVLRVGYLVALGTHLVIENDGAANYASMARSLRDGLGLHELNGGPVPLFPPFYSFTILALSWLTGTYELAGRVISIVAGVALPAVVYWVARRVFGRATALIAALIVAVSPYLVDLSVRVLSQSLYLLLLMLALAFAVRCVDSRRAVDSVVAGVFFGLAYLTRPEAIAIGAAVFLVMGFGARAAPRRHAFAVAGAGLIALMVVSAPYAVFISKALGQPALEAKSGMNSAISKGLLSGLTYEQTADAITRDGRPLGAEMMSDVRDIPPTGLRQRLAIAAVVAPRQAYIVLRSLFSRWVLAPVGAVLALIGFARGWSPPSRRRMQLLLTVAVAVSWLALLSLAFFWDLYLAAFVPIVTIWIAKGAVDVYGVLARAWPALRRGLPRRTFAAAGVVMLLGWSALGLLGTVRAVPVAPLLERAAGRWLLQHSSGPRKLAATFAYGAYYAHAQGVPLPYAQSSGPALAFLAREHVNYLLLSDAPTESKHAPYEIGWVRHGIPDPRATKMWSDRDPGTGETVVLYHVKDLPEAIAARRKL